MNKNSKNPVIQRNIKFQEQSAYEARLRRKGRGRKSGFRSSLYTQEYDRIFGETDIFKNLAEGK